ncbi:MAG: hypothetical protein AAF074_21970 [Pseudomonadota bacterium]
MAAIIFVVLMFLGPAYVALSGMFGANWMDVISGKTEDRVKYIPTDHEAL